jgi:hypothetical protein
MRSITFAVSSIALLVAAIPASAQGNMAHTHIGHVSTAFRDTPDGLGFLGAAQAEAAIATQHAGLAARDPANLQAMQTHAGHILNALDPTLSATGPGRGYGVKRAAEQTVAHIGMAAQVQGASQAVTTHANHISTSGQNTLARVAEGVRLAQAIQAATTAAQAAPLVTQLQTVMNQLAAGVDADGNGSIGWQAGEGGLAAVQTHVGLLRTAEGLQ